MGRQTPTALTSLHHMRCHIHAHQREPHHVLHFYPAIAFLRDEDFTRKQQQLCLEHIMEKVTLIMGQKALHYLSEPL